MVMFAVEDHGWPPLNELRNGVLRLSVSAFSNFNKILSS